MKPMNFAARAASAAGLLAACSLTAVLAGEPLAQADVQQHAWREAIARTAVPFNEGCFEAEYPSTLWKRVQCVEAPNKEYRPTGRIGRQVVGDGNDYAAQVGGLASSAVGNFPSVTGVSVETNEGQRNVYSIQLNSNFMNTAVCSGHSGCLSWEQFVYSSGEKSAFMQYWLINYGSCPSGWNTSGSSCWKNSAAVAVPQQAISTLSTQQVSATAVNGGSDTFVFTVGGKAYSTTGSDSVVGLATGWNASEFNIVGDGGGSRAKFNPGSSITVRVGMNNGGTDAPVCASNAGTTGETNNLTLGACTATGGATPYIQFVESN